MRQPFRQRHSAALDADQHQAFAAVALFHDLVGQAYQGALDLRGGHQPALDAQGWLVCASLMDALSRFALGQRPDRVASSDAPISGR